MWHHTLFHIKLLLKRLGILVLLYGVCRILFFLFNRDLFPEVNLLSGLQIMWAGLRFDIASIIYLNMLFILLHVVPNPWREKSVYQQFTKWVFYVFNGMALMLEAGDFIYFRYGLKRTSTHELGLTNDASVLPMVIRDFWFVFILVLLLLIWVEYLYRRTEFIRRRITPIQKPAIHYPSQIILMLLILTGGVIGVRGGIQPMPISPGEAGRNLHDERLSELVINTPFSVIYAFGHRKLEEPSWFSPAEVKQYYTPYQSAVQFYPDQQGQNVCVIVLESFSKEYIGFFNEGKGYTPFLDSLLAEGLSFHRFYANGKSSNQGIIATITGIPVLMEEPFISSLYKNNAFNGIATLLQSEGYYSAFFHGANNGSMGFDQLTKRAGFNAYYGRTEFANDAHFDGNWGIFDEPFLQFTAKEMSRLPQPFFTEIFTISSHHPYTLPKEYEGKFPTGSIPMLEVVGYADYALQQFFETAAQQPWFDQTLFILTADHNGPPTPGNDFYKTQIGAHSTWMLLYHPNGSFKGASYRVTQQTDIMPTVLDYVGYNGDFAAFGRTVFDTTRVGQAFGFHAGDYHYIEGDTAFLFNNGVLTGLYHIPTDSLLHHNIQKSNRQTWANMDRNLKAVIQMHHHAMIYNKLIVP